MSMSYTQLKDATKAFLEVDETVFNANIDRLIQQAEDKIYKQVRNLPVLKKLVTGAVTGGNRYLGMPDDLLGVSAMSIISGATYFPVLPKDSSFMFAAYPTTLQARPKYYSITEDETFVLAPIPDSSYTVELHYYAKPTSIVTATNTWLSDNAENVLLYGVIYQGYLFLKGDEDMMQNYKREFDAAIEDLKMLRNEIKRDDFYHGEERGL